MARNARFSATALAVGIAFFIGSFALHPLNGLLVDSFFRTKPGQTPHSDLVLIAFDAAATSGGEANMPAETLSQLLAEIQKDEPRLIAIIGDIDDRHYSTSELEQIGKAISPDHPVFVGFLDESSLGKKAPSVLQRKVIYAPGLISRDSFNFGADAVSRRTMIRIHRQPTVYSLMAQSLGSPPAQRVDELGDSLHAYIHWQGPPGTYPLKSIWSVFSRRESLNLKNKIVLIGHARRTRLTQDYVLTPYSRHLGDTSLLEGAAHGLVTQIQDKGLRRMPHWALLLLTLAISILAVNLTLLLSPVQGIGFMLILLGTLWSSGWIFLHYGWWLDLAQPILAAISAYYLVVPLRLGLEYRKRWQYQQKMELLAQIEQMKTCFLSLVSHDLKTPIAKIQGNAELILRESDSLVDKQKKGLRSILSTTDQMSEYVESILDLTRIESAQVPLSKTSRDINETVQEVIEEKRFSAAAKNITLQAELEPLFSIKYDSRLIRRVLSNLVENAIKYSPSNTTVRIRSFDEGDRVTVAIEDQGHGIAAHEQAAVFTKFYRGEGATASDTKGTGLGLYLVKYFIELHKGWVQLKSELGKGSTFTISLPV